MWPPWRKKRQGDLVHREVTHRKTQLAKSTTIQATWQSNTGDQPAVSLNQPLLSRSATGVRPQLEPGNLRPLRGQQRTASKHKKEPTQPGPDTQGFKRFFENNQQLSFVLIPGFFFLIIIFLTDWKHCSYWCDGWRTALKLWLCRHWGSARVSNLVEPTAGCSRIKNMWPACSTVLQGWHLLHSCAAPRQYGFTTWRKCPRGGKAEEILFLLSPTLDWAGSSTRLG